MGMSDVGTWRLLDVSGPVFVGLDLLDDESIGKLISVGV